MGGRFRLIVPAMALLVLVTLSTTLVAQNEPTSQPTPAQPNPAQPSPGGEAGQPAGQGESNQGEAGQTQQSQPTSPPATSEPTPTPVPTPVPPPPPASLPASAPSVTVIGAQEARGILGNDVRSSANEDMGRIVDVIVDGEGRTRAAIIDFGGFLGVGSRRIAVDWKALHFVPAAGKRYGIVLELTKDQVKLAPEVKEGKPIIVLGASGNLEPLP
jgi:hypothetical protein